MSVLIKRMNMPRYCAECRFLCELEGNPYCFAGAGIITTDLASTEIYPLRKRYKRCPLVEVSDNEEELINGMNALYGNDCEDCFIAQNTNLEDDDSPCRDCEVGE